MRDGTATVEKMVREFGFKGYRNIGGFDFSPGQSNWDRTSADRALVRVEDSAEGM